MSERKRQWGDKKDAYLVKDLDPFHSYFALLANNRADAECWICEEVDVTDLLKYIEKKRIEMPEYKTTMFHCVLMAVGKLLYNRPQLNRFIRNGHFYDRKDITLSFVAKRQFKDNAEESLMMLKIKDNMTVTDITKKVVGDVKEVRQSNGNNADDILAVFQKLPMPIFKFAIWVIKQLDKHAWLPDMFYREDPNFSSVLLSNLGSIKVDAPYHHLNNFGTNSLMMTIGEIHKTLKVNENGETVVRDVMNVGCTIDERVGDGFYFSKCIKLFSYYLTHPEILDEPVSSEVEIN